ncbi:hypothetical protein [Pseudomonas sp.]|uniref:hypothetical protein n=1 Tax=Pseudomonas sp. TaxID=306 RepID=UPI0028A696E5|nr:hypothetical protein [Pseudomonas sp.]
MRPTALSALLFSLLLSAPALVHAAAVPTPRTQAPTANPYNSPIQRANPNSRQGSVPATPPVRGPSTVPRLAPPTLENRGVGNGDNLRRQQRTPHLEPSRPPRDTRRTP